MTLLALTLLLFLPPPPDAHEVWLEDWIDRAFIQSIDPTIALMDEYRDQIALRASILASTARSEAKAGQSAAALKPRQAVVLAPPIVVTASPPSSPSPSTFPAAIEQWRGLVAAFFDPARVDHALSVMECETDPDGDPNSDNPTSSAAGLFQFLESTWNRVAVPLGYGAYHTGAVYDPTANVHAAAVLSEGGWNWSQWSCQPG